MASAKVTKTDIGGIFTLDEVAAYLKVGKRTVYRLSAAKKIPAFKVGGTWRYSRTEINRWITQQSMEGLDRANVADAAGKSRSNDRESK